MRPPTCSVARCRIGLDGGNKTDGKLQITLFENFDDYVKAGGPPKSDGVFIGGKAIVMVPLTSLGVRPVGSGYMLDREKSSKTLPHELTHQLTPNAYFAPGAMGWFTEGIAEYIAVTPYRSGAYSVRNNHSDIIAYATGYGTKNSGGRALGKDIQLPDLKTFMLQDYGNFLEQPAGELWWQPAHRLLLPANGRRGRWQTHQGFPQGPA